MIRVLATTLALTLAAVLSGCPVPTFTSDEGQWEFTAEGMTVDGSGGLYNTPLLEGARVCPSPSCLGECPEDVESSDLLTECFDHTTDGPGTVVLSEHSLCVETEGPGELTWQMEPTVCDANDQGYAPVPDRVVFNVVSADAVTVEMRQWADEYALENLSPGPGASFPSYLLNPHGEPFQVLAGQEVLFLASLWDEASEKWVAWNTADGGTTAAAVQGSFEIVDPGGSGWISLKLDEGAEVVLSLEVNDNSWGAATLVGVGAEAPDTVELVVAYDIGVLQVPPDSGRSAPIGARALFRDAEGRSVYGVPAEWMVSQGTLALYPGPYSEGFFGYALPGPDYAILSDSCLPPSKSYGERAATVKVSYGNLSDSMKLTWTLNDEPGEDPEDGWEKPEDCQGRDCSCDLSGGRQAVSTGVILLALAVLSRRRR